MTIDFEMIEAMVAAGATGAVVLAFLKLSARRGDRIMGNSHRSKDQPAKSTDNANEPQTPKPPRQRRATAKAEVSVVEANARQAVDDTPRARLFREGKTSLIALGVKSPQTAGQLIGKWLKLTHDDCQLIMATINKAMELQVYEPVSWILASLKGKVNSNGKPRNSTMAAFDELRISVEGGEVERDSRVIDLPVGSYQAG